MIRGQQLTAVIPVRGGSKGIPGKNLYRLGRDTLLERTIKLAKRCSYIDRVLVTTDDVTMYAIAQQHAVAAPALRPAQLAGDGTRTVDVLVDLINTAPIAAGYVLLLQVTTPLRTLADANAFCAAFDACKADAMVSLSPHRGTHPDKIQKIENGKVMSYCAGGGLMPRQQLQRVYELNGAFYLTHRDIILQQNTLLPEATEPFVMPVERSINLDGPEDLFLLECLLEKGQLEIEEYA